ncbi:MAG: HAD-IC family P-type ATPase [Bacteroidales bacterium]|jgi:magnesium-transporting ATPase (P-type)|nr:HAD-IC family P-type ATPase [Bacteroidales bacterium]
MEIKHKPNIVEEPWHSFEIQDVLKELRTTRYGLESPEVEKRLGFYGHNKMPEGKKITIWAIILHQLLNPLIFILIAAAVASVAIGEGKDAIFIFLVILINSILGATQEYNAEKSASGLQKLLKIKARVRRDGKDQEIESENLVPGDLVYLDSGIKVPADMRLLEAINLEIDESFLTGESLAAKKRAGVLRHDIGVAERTNMAFAGSTVMLGRGTGVVVGTGISTQVGLIARNVSEGKSAKPPLILRMEKFIKQITYFISALSILLAFLLRMRGMDFSAIFFFVVALAVSAIPEGLPVALTVALSIATRRMAKRNVIVRKLNSVESLGSCTIIASDKTGTLTVNEQTVKKIILPYGKSFSISGEGYNGEGQVDDDDNPETEIDPEQNAHLRTLIKIGLLANEGSLYRENDNWKYHGDAMDIALLGMGYKSGLNPDEIRKNYPLIDKIPYESEKKFSAAFCSSNGMVMIGAKGAVETILSFCNRMISGDDTISIDKKSISKQADEMAVKGYRVLAFAMEEYENFEKKEIYETTDIPPLVFCGLACFIDPLRPEAKESVNTCKKAGIKVLMITGDHPGTAGTIAQELGIIGEGHKVVTGDMLSEAGAHDSPAYEQLVASTTVFARVSPIQKLEIVDVLIREGEFVAVTGDGVNDAPALKRANIGVAMGSGTDVAKEVGSMIVLDDNFSSIVAGVEEGRFAYDNVRKVIYLLISTGAAEIILFILSIIAGLPLPLLAVQLLWLNLVTNGIQDVALAFEGGEPGTMLKMPRKPSESIFNRSMIRQTLVASATMGLVVFGYWYWLNNYTQMNEIHARGLILLLMVFMQNFHVFNCRSETLSAFRVPLKRNIILVFGVLAAQGIHILSMQIPFMQNILKIEPITINEWLYVLFLAIPMIISMEISKYLTALKLK